ncbi:MAG TPA: hypothetical protein PKE45_06155 [Caldilineaceae bacterium]|nr:hypothetical protein [Caldilineaceae bacterium]
MFATTRIARTERCGRSWGRWDDYPPALDWSILSEGPKQSKTQVNTHQKGLLVSNFVLIHEAINEGHTKYSPRHIALLIRKGKLPGKKQGKVWFVDLDALKRYEEEMARAGSAKFDPTRT